MQQGRRPVPPGAAWGPGPGPGPPSLAPWGPPPTPRSDLLKTSRTIAVVAMTTIGVLLVAVVVAGVVLARSADGSPPGRRAAGDRPAATAPVTAPVPEPLADACAAKGDSLPEAGIEPRPDIPAPVPDQPGQHALLVRDGAVLGHLDLAPGGGFSPDVTAASDAKSVFLVCALTAPEGTPTGQTCDYQLDWTLEGPGGMIRLELALARVDLHVYEAHSGRYVGHGSAQAAPGGCPDRTHDTQDGTLELDAGLESAALDWVRTHLAGARHRP